MNFLEAMAATERGEEVEWKLGDPLDEWTPFTVVENIGPRCSARGFARAEYRLKPLRTRLEALADQVPAPVLLVEPRALYLVGLRAGVEAVVKWLRDSQRSELWAKDIDTEFLGRRP